MGELLSPVPTIDYGHKRLQPKSRLEPKGGQLSSLLQTLDDGWRAGRRPGADAVLQGWPALQANDDAVLCLAYEELRLRQEQGLPADRTDFIRRFPQVQKQLEALFDARPAPPQKTPELRPGDRWGDYEILAELGAGAQGRVYLATQPALADRPVVLKITVREGEEHLSLARLLQSNIVPLYTAADDEVLRLRTLCMPYLGGATFDHFLAEFAATPCAARSGRMFIEILDRHARQAPLTLPVEGPARRFLSAANYVQSVCWIGSCLADALHYAHERGLIHLDIKPANVLLAADGQPMLLDFHLARSPILPDGPYPDWLGGTWAYVSPEQRAALAAIRTGAPIPTIVDGRSDVYSLGLMLAELLGARLPLANMEHPLPFQDRFPGLSTGLRDIIHRCLAFHANERYATAADLAIDLRLHLNDLPLRRVRNRSLIERWRKWRRRKPQRLAWVLAAAVAGAAALALAVAGSAFFTQRVREIDDAREEARHFLETGNFSEAAFAADRGRELAERLPGSNAAPGFQEQLRQARRGQAARDLHDVAERLRFLVGSEIGAASPALERNCRAVWEARSLLLDDGHNDPNVVEDLVDVAVMGADLLMRHPREPKAHQEASRMLDEAEAIAGKRAGLDCERQRLAVASGKGAATTAAPTATKDRLTVGRALLMAGDANAAIVELRRAVDERPSSFWAQFYLGNAAHRLGRYAEASTAFHACVALRPGSAESRCNRARSLWSAGRKEEALHDFDRALELDPTLAPAAFNRGVLHLQSGRLAPAAADFSRALELGADPAAVNYHLALVYQTGHDRAACTALRAALRYDPNHRPARDLLDRLSRGQ